jgi:hypothetical protein
VRFDSLLTDTHDQLKNRKLIMMLSKIALKMAVNSKWPHDNLLIPIIAEQPFKFYYKNIKMFCFMGLFHNKHCILKRLRSKKRQVKFIMSINFIVFKIKKNIEKV